MHQTTGILTFGYSFRKFAASFLSSLAMCVLSERFSIVRQTQFTLLWFCYTTLRDWVKNFALLSQPMENKTKTIRDLLTALDAGYMYLIRALIGSLRCIRLL